MDVWEAIFPYAAALLPTVGVAFLFYLIIRSMIEADRSERKALAQWRRDHDDTGDDSDDSDDNNSGDTDDGEHKV